MIGNEPAFPQGIMNNYRIPQTNFIHENRLSGGMTIRQYFVAQAMTAMSAPYAHSTLTPLGFASEAITLADACLAREAETRKYKECSGVACRGEGGRCESCEENPEGKP